MDDDIDKGSLKAKQPLAPEKKFYRLCVACLCTFLVITAIVGPLAAFTVVSCTSTDSCRIVGMLGLAGATCAEGSGEKSEYLMHGETCTVVCPAGLQPTTSALVCQDGVTEGGDELRCIIPPTPPAYASGGGLIAGAITSGELRTACERAKSLQCQGPPGSNAILLQWSGLTSAACSELMDSCLALNPEFEYEQFLADVQSTTPPATAFSVPAPAIGTCTLGCYNEIIQATNLPTLPPIVTPNFGAPQQPASNLCGGAPTATLPVCITVTGSCNAGDNGDYYRNQDCAGGYPQWVQEDESHRIRFDNKPAQSQNGKWILEQDVDPSYSVYGTYIARQNTFNNVPDWGTTAWSFKCSEVVNVFTTYHTYRRVDLTLNVCVCTRQNDCSGNGQAIGSKDLGPACSCQCDTGYAGKHCEIPLCRAPQIYRGAQPACEEGDWIYPNEICTPKCEAGYDPDRIRLVCNANAGFFTPNYFECLGTGVIDYAAVAASQYIGTTGTPPPCSAVDCSFRGTPTGGRRSDGSCVCTCMPNYVGDNCRTYSGSCNSPSDVDNSETPSCLEGSIVSTTCTAQCLPGYWPSPEILTCTAGSNALTPKTFKCFGGEPVAKTWCSAMQGVTIGTSALIGCLLMGICLYEMPAPKRKQKPFVIGDANAVELDQDGHGEYYVVRCEAKNEGSKLPDRIKYKVIDAPLQTGTSHLQNTSDEELRYDLDAGNISIGEAIQQGREVHFQQLQVGDSLEKPQTAATDSTLRALASFVEADSMDKANEADMASSEDLESQRGGELALGLPGYVPIEEDPKVQTEWLMEYVARDVEVSQKRYEDSKNASSERMTLEQKAAIEKANAIAKAVEDFAEERVNAEDAIRAALAAGDGEALRLAVGTGKTVIAKLEGAPVSVTSQLARCLKVGESRLEQYLEREDKRKGRDAWLDRMKRGEAADWHMSVTEFWQHAELGNVAAVRAGLRAKLPVLNRSPDGRRLTVLHIACKRACTEALKVAAEEPPEVVIESQVSGEGGNDIGAKAQSTVQGGPEAGAGLGVSAPDQVNDSSQPPNTLQEETASKPAQENVDPSVEITNKRIAVVEALLEARAIPNTTDSSNRTPLDLAIFEGGAGSEDLPIVQRLRAIGLLNAREAAEQARREAAAKAADQERAKMAKLTSQKKADNFAGR